MGAFIPRFSETVSYETDNNSQVLMSDEKHIELKAIICSS